MLRIDQTPKIEFTSSTAARRPRHRETGVDGGTARAAQRDLRRDRRRAAAAADRAFAAGRGEKGMSPRASYSRPVSPRLWWFAFLATVWILRGPGPMAFRDRPECRARRLQGRQSTGVPAPLGKASPIERANIWRRPPIAWSGHTTAGGKEFAGGLGFKAAVRHALFDQHHARQGNGIGNYSDQDFLNAMHRGIRRDGARLYRRCVYVLIPMSARRNALAIKAYLFSLPPAARGRRPPIRSNSI